LVEEFNGHRARDKVSLTQMLPVTGFGIEKSMTKERATLRHFLL
jgi:hypothetical protein